MTHTSGPWKVGGVDGHIWIERPNPADACICDIVESGFDEQHGDPYYMAEDHANAKLIAAAPDLLAALKAVVAMLQKEAPGTKLNGRAFDQLGIDAHNAIAKAEGR